MVTKKYNIGDLVFAKVKGYPAWPAKVTGLASGGKYAVFFYGTNEVGNIKPNMMWPYVEKFRDKFSKAHSKRKLYSEGLYQIEHTPEVALQILNSIAQQNDIENHELSKEIGPPDTSSLPMMRPVYVKMLSNNPMSEVQVRDTDTDNATEINPQQLNITCDEGIVNLVPSKEKVSVEGSIKKSIKISKKALDMKKQKVAWLKTEKNLVEILCQIQSSMCEDEPDLSACISALRELSDIDIKPLMVIKLPELLNTLKKLGQWTYGENINMIVDIRSKSNVVLTRIIDAFARKCSHDENVDTFINENIQKFQKVNVNKSEKEKLLITNWNL